MAVNYFKILLFGFVLTVQVAFSQSADQSFTVDLENRDFKELVETIEIQSNYLFHYNPKQFLGSKVFIHIKEAKLSTVLDSVFYNTQFRYSFDKHNVYITEGREVLFELPTGFFQNENLSDANASVALYDYLYSNEQKERLTEEEKIVEIGIRTNRIKTAKATISGFIRNSVNGEPIIGAVIYNETTKTGSTTDAFGHYELTIPTGQNNLRISCVGMSATNRKIMLYSTGKLDVELREFVTSLREVVVESDRGVNISNTQMGLEKMDIKTMKQVPVAFGETDVLKVILTLPGVQSVGESSTGLNVRGGATDQNLILFDEATIFNSSHLFGFFSAFNPDVVKGVELYKSGIPAEYGGRLSSVMSVTTREGNKKKFGGSGGIGLVTGRLTLEGPLNKGKTSFLVGGRSTYSSWLLSKVQNKSIQNSNAGFYDLNLHINHEINEKNTIDGVGYYSNDKFRLNNDTLYQYNNMNAAIKWKHIVKNNLFAEFVVAYSKYQYNVSSDARPLEALELKYNIEQLHGKADFTYFANEKSTFNFGGSIIHYHLNPGSKLPKGDASNIIPDAIQDEQALESAIYASNKYDITPKLSLYMGLRYSLYNFLGPHSEYQYQPGVSRTESSIVDSTYYPAGKPISTYHGPEYRFSSRYMLSNNTSLKFSAQRMRQYIHMLSNTTAISPTDIWKLSDPYIQPTVGDQVSLGLYKNFRSNTIETSVEAYYKTMNNFLDYKGGAILIMNHHIETDALSAKGRAYGIEFLIKKVAGKLNGWISYTYSRSLLRTISSVPGEMVNRGKEYPSNFDKPHSANLISNYKFSKRFSISLNGTYSTGRPITVPLQKYGIDGSYRLLYTERNQFRIPDYFRMDFAINVEGNHKISKLAHSSWSLSVYNLTGRKNVYSVFFKSEQGVVKGYKLSIFGNAIPTVTYNFRF